MGSTTLRRELAGIALLLFALFLGAAIAFPGADVASCMAARGPTGPVGACLRSVFVATLGLPATVLLPFLPLVYALRVFRRIEADTDRSWLVFLGGLALILPVAIALAMGATREVSVHTGLWGSFAAFYLQRAFGFAGAWIVVALLISVLTAVTLAWNPVRVLIGWKPKPSALVLDQAPSKAKRRWPVGEENVVERESAAVALAPTPEEMPGVDPSFGDAPLQKTEERGTRKKKRTKADIAAEHAEKIAAVIDANATVPEVAADELPTADILSPPPPRNRESSQRELDAMGVKLMDALRTFRVDGELVGRTTGPVVTQFEVEPAPGVKVRQIANLSNDLALAMRAQSIRVVAPIPGRGAVGVEVPNPVAEIVAFREIIESKDFQQARAALPIALGKDLEGKPVIADLAKMPHLLIAGATGSGKSVCVNTLITSLVFRHTPKTLRFLMVDPKMVELSVYNQLPHLRHKVITDNRDAAAVLKWAVLEMQERYELLAANGCRNIQDFNRKVQDGLSLSMPKRPDIAFEDLTWRGGVLPYIVVVIDELADLMMTVQGEVETPLAMLAQKARAVGVHLILATQRPSVNVITGLIKANFPSRIAFRVASQVDSRTILDGIGAESLLGSGDMLFIPPGKSEPWRLQGAFIPNEDTERLMQWYRDERDAKRKAYEAQGLVLEESVETEPDILEAVRQREALEQSSDEGEDADVGDRDKLFREAAEVVLHHQQGSTSLLQRRLKIGYGRAARIIDQLHAAGILGPPDGSKPRDVLVGLDELDRISPRA